MFKFILLCFLAVSQIPSTKGQCGITVTGTMDVPDCSFNAAKRRKRQIKSIPIVGGEIVSTLSYPWQVFLRTSDGFMCGGSIIGPKHILTAAHCLREPATIEAFVGHEAGIPQASTGLSVVNSIPHPDYDNVTNDNDIAILELENLIEYGENVRPVCLPDKTNLTEPLAPGIALYASGYGLIAEDVRDINYALRAVCLPTQDISTCSLLIDIPPSQFCAGYYDESKDTCEGDSGGPLVEIKDGRAILQGIVSSGIGCANNIPGLNTNVALFWTGSMIL